MGVTSAYFLGTIEQVQINFYIFMSNQMYIGNYGDNPMEEVFIIKYSHLFERNVHLKFQIIQRVKYKELSCQIVFS